VPRLCELYPGIRLTTEEKARKNHSQGSRRVPVGTMKIQSIQNRTYRTEHTEQNIQNRVYRTEYTEQNIQNRAYRTIRTHKPNNKKYVTYRIKRKHKKNKYT
jgi:Ser/Thr protein kinase RdoA (MazF antagonist)